MSEIPPTAPDPEDTLEAFARRELTKAGLFDPDSDYEGMIAKAVMELIETFSAQGHSGFSSELTLQAFNYVARRRPLTLPKDARRRKVGFAVAIGALTALSFIMSDPT